MARGDRWARERAALERRVAEGERVLARGRVHQLQPPQLLGGSTYDYLVVTDRRLLWSAWGAHHALDLDVVREAAEGAAGHRCTIVLTHDPVPRTEWAPRHRFLWFRWGNSSETRPRRTTTFAFSRRDTDAATALREQLRARGIDIGTIEMPPPPPREGQAMLTYEPRDPF